mgnify:CR=1 FL=1
MLRSIFAAVVALTMLGGAALAQQTDRGPPENGKKLSEIIAKVEQRQVEIRYDPVSGNPK